MLHRFTIRFARHAEVYVICERHTKMFLQQVVKQGYLSISISDEKILDAKCAFCREEEQIKKITRES